MLQIIAYSYIYLVLVLKHLNRRLSSGGKQIKGISWIFSLEGILGIISSALLTSDILIPRFKVNWMTGRGLAGSPQSFPGL